MTAAAGGGGERPPAPGGRGGTRAQGHALALGVSALVVATALWGATFVLLRDLVAAVDPGTLVCARFAAATGVFAVLMALLRRWPSVATVGGATVAGLCGAAGFLFQSIGLRSTSAGSSAFLTAGGAVSTGLLAWVLLGQRPGREILGGMAIAGAGSALLSLREAFHFGLGEAWTLVGSVAFALQIIAIARFAPRADPVAFAGVQVAVIALATAPLAGDVPERLAALDASDGWRVAYLVVAASVVAPLLQVFAQRTVPAGRVGLLFALEPVFALAFAVSVGMERFAPHWWVGAALILLAVFWVERRAARPQEGARQSTG